MLLIILAFGSTVGQAAAQVLPGVWPRCIEERDVQQVSLSGLVCECGHTRGGTMIGRPPGWRWSCDIMKSNDGLDVDTNSSTVRRGAVPGFGIAPQREPEPELFGRSYRP